MCEYFWMEIGITRKPEWKCVIYSHQFTSLVIFPNSGLNLFPQRRLKISCELNV